MSKCMKSLLKGDAKTLFLHNANLGGSHTVDNFTKVKATMTAHLTTLIVVKDNVQKGT